MAYRSCNMERIVDVWAEIDNLIELRKADTDYFNKVAIDRLENALENLNAACDITDEDVEEVE